MASIMELAAGCAPVGHLAFSGPSHAWVWAASLLAMFLAFTWPFSGAAGKDSVRDPILAGTWYEADPAGLEAELQEYLKGRGRPPVDRPEGYERARSWAASGRRPAALIVPHAGHVYSGPCAGETFSLLEKSGYRRVVLLGPSHRVGFRGAALSGVDAFGTPLGRIPLDTQAIRALSDRDGFQIMDQAHAAEHSLEIELPFLQTVLEPGFTLVPIVIGQLNDDAVRDIATALGELWDEQTVIVISSDFTHYGPSFGYVPFSQDIPARLADLDGGAIREILDGDGDGFESYQDSTEATICGAGPIRILLEMSEQRDLSPQLIDYYRSGDMTGDFNTSVSYAGIAFFEKGPESLETSGGNDADLPRALTEDEEQYLLSLARSTVQALVAGQPGPKPEVPERFGPGSPLHQERGVFVTLTTQPSGRLRGCIGSIVADQPLVEGVIRNAVAAASKDPRFEPVGPDDYPNLLIEISVLTPPQPVPSYQEIVLGRDGIILEKRGRRAVFLPQVAPEQGWDLATTLTHLSMKAGLSPEDWKSGAGYHVFQAQVFEEAEP